MTGRSAATATESSLACMLFSMLENRSLHRLSVLSDSLIFLIQPLFWICFPADHEVLQLLLSKDLIKFGDFVHAMSDLQVECTSSCQHHRRPSIETHIAGSKNALFTVRE